MTESKKLVEEKKTIESPSRRKAVKTLAASAGALAAYHTLPVNWSTPIIEQIFLPAHAQTSGPVESPPVESPPVDNISIEYGDYDSQSQQVAVTITSSRGSDPIWGYSDNAGSDYPFGPFSPDSNGMLTTTSTILPGESETIYLGFTDEGTNFGAYPFVESYTAPV